MSKFHLERERWGQVTVLVLLLAVLGLTAGLSVVSRSLSDLKQASFVDFGTKALAAAETGAEYALAQIGAAGYVYNPTNCTTLASPSNVTFDSSVGISSLNYTICLDSNGFKSDQGVGQDAVSQTDISLAGWTAPFDVFWKDGGAVKPSVEVSVFYYNSSTGTYSVKRYAFNSVNNSSAGNNFANGVGASTCSSVCPASAGAASFTSCSGTGASAIPGTNGSGNNAVAVRVRPIYGASDILVCAEGSAIPGQYYTIVSKATTVNGTVRRVQITREVNAHLPSIFDNVIFSGGSITK